MMTITKMMIMIIIAIIIIIKPIELFTERGPHSLVSRTKELLERKSSGSGLENRDYGHRASAALTMRHPSVSKSWH
jgi:hypothetical protein